MGNCGTVPCGGFVFPYHFIKIYLIFAIKYFNMLQLGFDPMQLQPTRCNIS